MSSIDSLIVFGAKDLFIVIFVLAALAWVRLSDKKKLQFAATFIIAGVAAMALINIFGFLYYHPRPFVLSHTTPLVSAGLDNAFPSEHTVLSATMAAIIYFFSKRLGVLAFGLAILVGASRVAAHVHYAVDIIAGLMIGIAAACAGYFLAKKFQIKSS